jgi:anaerobic selenocysteine-containing dehydrogenase
VDGAGGRDFPLSRYLLNRLPEALNAAASSPVQALFVNGVNPAYSLPDTVAVEKGLRKIPLIVSFSAFMDETAAMAHYILPNHVYLERFEELPAAQGFPRPIISLLKPVVRPLFNTRHIGDAVMQLAKAVGGNVAAAFGWESYEACLQETLGDKWDALKAEGYWTEAKFAPGAFETKSKKFEFANADIAMLPAYTALKAPGDDKSFPLTLIPFDTLRLASGGIGAPPFLVKSLEETLLMKNDGLVEINPIDAQKLNLVDGADAVLSTPKGTARVKVTLSEGIMPGLVAMVRGLGHTAYDRFLAGKGVNINRLMGSIEAPGTGFEAAWGVRAQLTKA